MKLHALEIQAFGPFANKEAIDFSTLGENALFLIDGPTGAGKSTILHAICYALYGETTDSDRKDLGLRCDYADANVLTELSLEFSIRHDRYRITRIPTQMRPAKRGGGKTEQKPTAHLRRVLDNGKEETLVAKKTREADSEVARIIGLTPDQFLQVMVLPQGKFRALLLAKSDDRQAILSTLFQTEIYKRIEQLLKDKAGTIEKQNQAFEDQKGGWFSDVFVTNNDELAVSVKEARCLLEAKKISKDLAAEKKQQAAIVLEQAKELGQSFDTQLSTQKELEDCLHNTAKIETDKEFLKRAEKANAIAPQWKVLQGVLKDIETKQAEVKSTETDQEKAIARVDKAQKALEKAGAEYQQRDILKAEEGELRGYQEKQERLQVLKDASILADKNHQQAIDQKIALEVQVGTMTQAVNALQSTIESLGISVENKAECVEKKLISKGFFEQGKVLAAVQADLSCLKKDYQKQNDKFEKADKAYRKAEQGADKIEMLWFSNQAAVLAKKIEENQACMVCGSLDHPNKATFSKGSIEINQDAVDKARKTQNKLFKVLSTQKEVLQNCLHSVSDKEKNERQLVLQLSDQANRSVADLEIIYLANEEALIRIEANEKKRQQFKKQKTDKESECLPLDNKLNVIESEIPELIAIKSTAKSKLDSVNDRLPEKYRQQKVIEQALVNVRKKITNIEFKQAAANKKLTEALKDESSIQSKLSTLKHHVDDLKARQRDFSNEWEQALVASDFTGRQEFVDATLTKKEVDSLQKSVDVHEDAVKALQVALGLLAEQLNGKARPDLEKLQQISVALSDDFVGVEKLWEESSQVLKKRTDTQKKIKQIEEQQAEITKQYEVVGVLSKAASGRGNVRVSLERFVLGNILDQVLSVASDRLYTMSKGQYRLIRQNEEDQKRNTTAGLDLAIDDAYSGKSRPVATLSGGESFMASLALALGLSDVVQERSGGIQLDTLFIDEGFGSLDQESLQLAINTLVDLQSTGRSIGIISHVSELKEQMAKRIEVAESRQGSAIRIIV